MLYQFCLVSFPKQQANAAVCALALRSYATGADLKNAKIIKNPDLGALKRGTGGRSSFNGYVCTLFGASGFVGKSVANQLGKIGTQIIIPYRGNFDDEELKSLKLAGDLGQVLYTPFYLKDEASIRKAVKYSNVVINLIGTHFESRNFSYDDVHVKGARAIAKACKESGVERLIHFSALGANEPPERFLLPKPIDFFPSKLRGERAVMEEFPDATIIRPATIYGMLDKFIWSLFDSTRATRKSIPIWGKGKNIIKQPVYVSDVGKGTVRAMLDHTTRGKIFQFIGPERYYLEELIKYGLALSQRDKFDWGYHDSRLDPVYYLKIAYVKYILSMLWHNPKLNMDYQMHEIECTSDKPVKRMLDLQDLGIEPTRLEDVFPSIISYQFLAHAYHIRAPDEFNPIPPPSPVTRGIYA